MSKSGKVIVIDVGHGHTPAGHDSGAVGTLNGKQITENEVNHKNAETLRAELEKRGYTVVLTTDEGERTDKPKHNFKSRFKVATKHDADLYISLHADASTDKGMSGTSIYVDRTSGKHSIFAAEHVLNSVNKNHKVAFNDVMELEDGHRGPLWGLKKKIPGILIEAGFVTNSSDLKNMMDDASAQKFAATIADGIDGFTAKQMLVAKAPEQKQVRQAAHHESHKHDDHLAEMKKFQKLVGTKDDGIPGANTFLAAHKKGYSDELAKIMGIDEKDMAAAIKAAERGDQKFFANYRRQENYANNIKEGIGTLTAMAEAKSIGADMNLAYDDLSGLAKFNKPNIKFRTPAA